MHCLNCVRSVISNEDEIPKGTGMYHHYDQITCKQFTGIMALAAEDESDKMVKSNSFVRVDELPNNQNNSFIATIILGIQVSVMAATLRWWKF
jgi:hypothetical protein